MILEEKNKWKKKIIAVNKDEIRGLGKVSLWLEQKKKPTPLFFFFPCSWMLHGDSLKKEKKSLETDSSILKSLLSEIGQVVNCICYYG